MIPCFYVLHCTHLYLFISWDSILFINHSVLTHTHILSSSCQPTNIKNWGIQLTDNSCSGIGWLCDMGKLWNGHLCDKWIPERYGHRLLVQQQNIQRILRGLRIRENIELVAASTWLFFASILLGPMIIFASDC